jgi:5-methylcytosine-specific restriction endonuclease McrA
MALKKEIREKVHKKYDCKCGYCGIDIAYKEMQVDHIIPQNEFITHIKNQWRIPEFLKHLTEEDMNHYDNLMPTCRVCNLWKSTHTVDGFRKEVSEQVKRLNDYSTNYRMAKKYDLVIENVKPIIFYFERGQEEKVLLNI